MTYLRSFRRYVVLAAATTVTLSVPALVWGSPQTPEGWRLPFDNAADGLAKMSITQGPWGSFSHAGSMSSGQWAVDYSTAPGTTFPVRAPADGIVWGTLECSPGCTPGVGYVVVLQHADGYFSRFLHLDNNRREVPAVDPGQLTPKPVIKQGDVIGHAWSTGGVPVHLHFEVRRGMSGTGTGAIHSGASVPSFEIPGQWWRPCYHPPIPAVSSLIECGEPEAAAYYPVGGARPVHPDIPPATALRHLASEVAPPVIHPSYTGPVLDTGAYLHRGSSPNPNGTQTFFATSMYSSAIDDYFDLPSTWGYDASTLVGAVPCQSNRYYNWAGSPYGASFNLISLTPKNCTGTAPHLAAWIDPPNLFSDKGVVLEFDSGPANYVVFQILRLPPSGPNVAYRVFYDGPATSIPAPGGYSYQVCRNDPATQCSPIVWAGDATPVFQDTFSDATLLDQWAVATGTSDGPWSIDANKLRAEVGPDDYIDLQSAAPDQATWSNYTVVFEMWYDEAAGSVGEQVRVRTQGPDTCTYTDCYAIEFYHVGADQFVTHLDGSPCPSRPCANSAPITFPSATWRQFVIDVRDFSEGGTPYSVITVFDAPLGAPLTLVRSYLRTSSLEPAGHLSLVVGTGDEGALVKFDNIRVFKW